MRLDDATAAVADTVNTALAGIAGRTFTLVTSGMEGQQDGEAGPSGDRCYLDINWESDSSVGPDATLRGSAMLEVHLRPEVTLPLDHHTVGEALRGTLEQVSLAVYGTTSGTPATLQGLLLLKDFRWSILDTTPDRILCQADISLLER